MRRTALLMKAASRLRAPNRRIDNRLFDALTTVPERADWL